MRHCNFVSMLAKAIQSCLFVTPWAVAHQAPLSMELSRQEHWSGQPFPSPGDLPNPGAKLASPALPADSTFCIGRQVLYHWHRLECTVLFSSSVVSDSLWPHGLQYLRLPHSSPSPRACSDSCLLRWWCHPTILSSVVPWEAHCCCCCCYFI